MTGLHAHLVTQGHIAPNGTGRRAQARRCPHCRHNVIVGDDDERCALTATCDPQPLTPLGEALARVDGLATYNLAAIRGGYQLWYRGPEHIEGKPAGTNPREDVLRQHRCGNPPPVGPLTMPSVHIPTRPTKSGATPPF